MQYPYLMALFQKRINGDDALLDLARLRFKEAGLAPEFYAETPDEMDFLLKFKPLPDSPAVVHMNREIDLFKEESHNLIMNFAERFAGQVFGLVIHDQPEIISSFDDYCTAVREADRRLNNISKGPFLFIEYAMGLEFDLFLEVFKRASDAERVSACVDIGHIGLKKTRDIYSLMHTGEDVCRLSPDDPGLIDIIEDVENSVSFALPAVLGIIKELGSLKKHIHFHLHDGHPLSVMSPFGISDHLSFLEEIPIPFEFRGKRSLPLMYGAAGLSDIVKASLDALGPERVSFSLEIHPAAGKMPLGNASNLFNQWKDLTNAEKMNSWLSVLLKNHQLLLNACENNASRH